MSRLAATEHGVLSTDELYGCGLTPDAIATRVARGWLHRRFRRVYAVGHVALTTAGVFLAAVKACGPGAVLSHFSAAVLWDLIEWDQRAPEVLVLGTTSRRHAGIRVHRTATLDPEDIRQRQGIPVTSPARTLVDLAAVVDAHVLRRAVRQALSLRHVTLAEVLSTMDRLGPRRGRRNLRDIIVAGGAPTRSVLEDRVFDLMVQAGIARPQVNSRLVLDGRVVVPDFLWPSEGLVVEADGQIWHDNKLAREDDAERQALLEAHGYRVLRVTWEQAVAKPGETLARIRAAGAPEAPTVA